MVGLISEANFIIQGVAMPVVMVFGLVGNILSILVLRSPGIDMKVTFREVLMMLAIFDCFFITTASISFSLPQLSSYWKVWIHPHIFPWLLPVIQTSLSGFIWSTVSVTVERYVSVVHPRHWFTSLSSAIYVVPVVIFTLIWNIPHFTELNTCYKMMNMTMVSINGSMNTTLVPVPRLCPSSLRTNLSYTRDYIFIANFLGMALIPFALLAIINFKLFRTIKASTLRCPKTNRRQKRNQKIASLLILLVAVFGCCNMVRIITNFYEVCHIAIYGRRGGRWPVWCDLITFLSHLLLILNSSSNIVIYCWKDQKFRTTLLHILGWRSPTCPRWLSRRCPRRPIETSSQLRAAEVAGGEGREEEEEGFGEDGELVQMSKTNNKSQQISTIEFSTVKTSAF